METATGLRSPRFLCRASGFTSRSCVLAAHRSDFLNFDHKCQHTNRFLKGCCSFSLSKNGQKKVTTRSTCVKASASSSSSPESVSPIAPLQMQSPVGQFLSQILVNHPHLLPAAVEQQLEQLLQTDKEAEKEEPIPSGTDMVLYRRIAEVKANEKKRALEEILYSMVVQKFVEADVSLVPALPQDVGPFMRVDKWSADDEKLEKLHSTEAYEMIKNHLSLILGQRLSDSNSVAPISKLRVGQVYAASVMYGYFLKRVDQRFQLEKSMKMLPWGTEEEETAIKHVMPDESRPPTPVGVSHPEVTSWPSPGFDDDGIGNRIKPSRLRSYVMSFDSDTLQRYATIRSKEAFSIIEKHTEALFGRPEIVITPQGTIDSSKDEVITISFGGLRRLILEAVTFGSFLWDVGGLRRLILEAVTFGSFLWDVESFVDSRYHFVTS